MVIPQTLRVRGQECAQQLAKARTPEAIANIRARQAAIVGEVVEMQQRDDAAAEIRKAHAHPLKMFPGVA